MTTCNGYPGGEGPPPTNSTLAKWRRTIAVDFDGVIHAYGAGWLDGTCYDLPVPGAKAALETLHSSGFRVVVFTTRQDLAAVATWLYFYNIPYDELTNKKVPALAYIDDRAVRFTNWPDILKMFC